MRVLGDHLFLSPTQILFSAQSREHDGDDIIISNSSIKCVPDAVSPQSLSFFFRLFLSLIQMLFCAQRREDEGDDIIIISRNNIKCV